MNYRFFIDPKTRVFTKKALSEKEIEETVDFGESCIDLKSYKPTIAQMNNLQNGSSRVGVYTFPDGEDNGLRFSPLYPTSGLDITEIKAYENALAQKQEEINDKVSEEYAKILSEQVQKTKEDLSTKTTDKVSQSADNK